MVADKSFPGDTPWSWRRRVLAIVLALMTLLALSGSDVVAAPPRVYRGAVVPHWFEGGARFWYRNDLKDGAREFVLVDARAGTRGAAFDHARAAAALAKLMKKDVSAERLPVESLEFAADSKAVVLRGVGEAWRLNLESYETTALAEDSKRGTLPAGRRVRASTRTGPESAIVFVNKLDVEVELFWVDPDGGRKSYGTVAAGATHRQHTFGGHVWIVTKRPKGELVAVFEAADAPQTALIDGREPDAQRNPSADDEGDAATHDASQTNARATRVRRDGPIGDAPESIDSPDGKRSAFVRDHNLWLRDVATNKAAPLSLDGSAGHTYRKDTSRRRSIGMGYDEPEAPESQPDVVWSPDSTKLVALQTRVVPERRVQLVESTPGDQVQPKLHSYPYLKPGDEIPVQTPRLFDVAAGREIPIDRALLPNPWEIGSIRWAADGSRFTFLYNERGHQTLRVISVNAADGAARVLVEERSDTFLHYSGKFLLEWLGDDEFLWMSERDGWNHLWLCDANASDAKAADAKSGEAAKDGPPRQVTHGNWNVRELIRVDRTRGEVWFRAVGVVPEQDPYHVHVCRANLDGTGFVVLTEGDGTHRVQWSPDNESFLDTWSRVDLPPVTVLRKARDGSLLCDLETADASEVTAARGRYPERFVAKGRDDTTDIWGVIHRPREFDPKKKYAVVENIYAGPHGQHVPKEFRAEYRHQEEITDRGLIVVQIDGMGTAWRSKKFHDVCWKNLRDAGFPDRIAWMKAAAAKHAEFDLDRVGIYGGSAGGQNAMAALLWHHPFYKAAVADCGCHDNRMDKIWWNEQWMGWPVGPQYAENSNVANAHRLEGSLMLVVGELDRNVDPASTMQAAAALVKANKEFDLVVVPGTGHGACETPWASRRRANHFARHLGGPR